MFENDSSQQEPRLSRLAIATLFSILVAFGGIALLVVSSKVAGKDVPGAVEVIGEALIFGGFVGAPFLGIAAMITISRSNGTLSGLRGALFATIGISAVLAFVFGVGTTVGRSGTLAYQMLCGTNLKGIGNALLVYGNDNGDRLPDPAHWCDLLVTKADISPASFFCKASKTVKGESSYAMNVAATGMKLSEIPADMVLVFEVLPDENAARTFPVASRGFAKNPEFAHLAEKMKADVAESRWNQVCGPERVDIISHENGCNILFGDMHVEFVQARRLGELRWSLDKDFKLPPPILQKPKSAPDAGYTAHAVVAGAAMLVMACIAFTYRGKADWGLSLTMAAAAGGAGAVLGMASQVMYTSLSGTDTPVSLIAGAVVGVLAGLAFTGFAAGTSGSIVRNSDVKAYATAIGMWTGAISAMVIHCILIALSREPHAGFQIVAGIPFGILAGAILGAIGGAMIRQEPYLDKSQPASEESEV